MSRVLLLDRLESMEVLILLLTRMITIPTSSIFCAHLIHKLIKLGDVTGEPSVFELILIDLI